MHLLWTRWRLVLGGIVIVAACIVVDALWIEPQWIEVTHQRIAAPLSTPLKIAHLTDIHMSRLGSRERRMLRIVEEEKPDLIVITGDSINVTSDYPAFREALTSLHAPLGVWVVRGNHEDWWPINNELEFYESAGAKLLMNANHEAREGVWLIGFDDLFGGSPDAVRGFAGVPEAAYKIALFHSPMSSRRWRVVATLHWRVTAMADRYACHCLGHSGCRRFQVSMSQAGFSSVEHKCT